MSESVATIEALAVAEYRSWMAKKIVAYRRHAAHRDNARRLNPSTRPNDEPSEAEKKKDRNSVATARVSDMRDRG